MAIATNNHWRPFAYRHDVPADVLADQFSYHDDDVSDGYFNYRGYWYHLDQFMRFNYPGPPKAWKGWQASHPDSFFSGILIRLSEDGDEYQVATYIQTSEG